MTKANKKCFFVEWGRDDCWQANPEEKNRRRVKKLMYWLLCIWVKDMWTCGLWKAHQVNVIRHQQFLRLNKDGHKSIFLQFYRCYLNISIAEFTLGSAFHEGKPVILGWKKYWDENVKTYSYRQLLSFWSPTRWHFIHNSLEETNLKFDFKRTFISCSAAANENIAQTNCQQFKRLSYCALEQCCKLDNIQLLTNYPCYLINFSTMIE